MSSKSKIRLRKEEYPLPSNIDATAALVKEIMEKPGDVFKIVLESGRPVVAYREADADISEGDPSILAFEDKGLTLDAALRMADLYEWENEEASAFEKLFDLMHVLREKGWYPVCWATGPKQADLLKSWLFFSEREPWAGSLDELMGFPIIRLKSLPEDALILCGAPHADGHVMDVRSCIKTSIELRGADYEEEKGNGEPGGEVGDPVGNGSGERGGAAHQLEDPSGGDEGTSWSPQGFFGVWMDDRSGVR